MKVASNKREKENDFKVYDLVLTWDAKMEEKGKHGRFDHLWYAPFIIVEVLDKTLFS